jgi:hypothetical protein
MIPAPHKQKLCKSRVIGFLMYIFHSHFFTFLYLICCFMFALFHVFGSYQRRGCLIIISLIVLIWILWVSVTSFSGCVLPL